MRACFGDADGWLIVSVGREPHSDVGKYTHNRWEELMSDVLARRFTESQPTAGAATLQAAVGTAARPMHIGITSAGSRWNEARRFADELRRDDRQAGLVIANEVKA